MKILQISPQFPYPLDSGGKIGIYNITKQLSKFGAEIFLVAFSRKPIPDEYLAHFRTFCHPFVLYENTSNDFAKLLKYFVLNKPIFVEKYFTKKAKRFFSNLLNTIDFDIIHLDHTATFSIGKWLSSATGKPVGLRLHNIEWLIWKRYLDELPFYSPARIFMKQQTKLLKEKEAEAIQFANVSFTCTENDRMRALELCPNANVKVASPGVDLNLWQPKDNIERNRYEIVFATTYEWVHNVDGLRWYLENVHPIVLKKEKNVVLTILGKNPPEFLRNYPNVDVVGYVDKVQPYYNRASLFIVPLFVGSGVRMRILEAMSMELPVVSTSIGAEGIEATTSEGLFIADDKELFAEKVLELIKAPDHARELGRKAREFIQRNFSVEVSIRVIFEEYQRIVKERK